MGRLPVHDEVDGPGASWTSRLQNSVQLAAVVVVVVVSSKTANRGAPLAVIYVTQIRQVGLIDAERDG